MAVCIAGMHRSGTSMLAQLLNLCGLNLGPESELATAGDRAETYWENVRFVGLNDQILARLGGAWDVPPAVTDGWELRPEMIPLRGRAADLVQGLSHREPWGWKDPRSCLTLPFWKQLFPDLKVVICLRNPLEVAQSLFRRGYASDAFSMKLWLAYNRRVLSAVRPEDRVITHYDAYFHDPRAELRRVLSLLKIVATEEAVDRASSAASRYLRHNRATTQDLLAADVEREVVTCYMEMCAEAGAVYQLALQRELVSEARPLARGEASDPHGYREALHVLRLETELRAAQEELREREKKLAEFEATRDRLEEIETSVGWRFLEGLRRVRVRVFPPHTRRERVFQAALRVADAWWTDGVATGLRNVGRRLGKRRGG